MKPRKWASYEEALKTLNALERSVGPLSADTVLFAAHLYGHDNAESIRIDMKKSAGADPSQVDAFEAPV